MKKYVICNTVCRGDNNAGSKAGRDAVKIAVRNGYEFVKLYEASGIHTTIANVCEGFFNTWKLCLKLEKGDIVFLQYPVNRWLMGKMYRMLNKKHAHLVTLIHDIDFLRNVSLRDKGIQGMRELELSLLSQSEYIIAHNPAMICALKDAGLKAEFVSLNLFDYIYEGEDAKRTNDGALVVAGNLAEKKAGYIYKLKGQRFKLSLYGSNLGDNFMNDCAEYHGSFPPDELIENMSGTYGLVWDGPEVDSCAGDYGQYLRINNPHKVSLYIAAGLPVVVWKQSALYPFVVEHNIGFGVDSLLEIDREIEKQDYEFLVMNVSKMQGKVRGGIFLTSALEDAERRIQGMKLKMGGSYGN